MEEPAAHELGDWPGQMGAHIVAGGTWFAVEAPHARGVELCLFDPGAPGERRRVPLFRPAGVRSFVGFVAGVGPGAHYGYRVHGPFEPDAGHMFNPRKLLVDPWARALAGPAAYHPCQRTLGEDGGADLCDSAVAMLRSVVVDGAPLRARAADAPPRPRVPVSETVMYECHVRGMTMHHPGVPEPLRGTYLGLCHPPVVEHLRALSVTTLSVMPVAECYDEEHLVERGLRNYWGYAPLACFAPSRHYATDGGDPRLEFRTMVDTLHDAGIEVLLDVVFNHTPEGDARGTTLSLRGVDHAAFYALSPTPPHVGIDHTGCGNSLDLSKPTCLRFVMDALRFWVGEMGVDGFRFDLAVTLGRTPEGFSPSGPLLAAITQDPVLRDCKLVAEPWDVGLGGYRLGGFPPGFSEWNDRYRDGVRRALRGDAGQMAELATRLSGSSDVFSAPGRGPAASVNFVTSHDGFTLRDLVSYSRKHNDANGEGNRDGHSGELCDNLGHEGPTDDPRLQAERQTAMRAMLLCLSFSHGVPMFSHGDELGRTQCGNNNAYCQDNALTHLDWGDPFRHAILPFLSSALALRAQHPCMRPAAHLHGGPRAGRPDLLWLRPDAQPMAPADWNGHATAMRVCGVKGDGVLLLINCGSKAVRFVVPSADAGFRWRLRLDAHTVQPRGNAYPRVFTVAPRAAALLDMEETA